MRIEYLKFTRGSLISRYGLEIGQHFCKFGIKKSFCSSGAFANLAPLFARMASSDTLHFHSSLVSSLRNKAVLNLQCPLVLFFNSKISSTCPVGKRKKQISAEMHLGQRRLMLWA